MIDTILEWFAALPGQLATIAGQVTAVTPTWVLVTLFAVGAVLFLAGAAGIILKRRTRRPARVDPAPAPRTRAAARRDLDRVERERTRVAHIEYDTGVAADLHELHGETLARLDAEFERSMSIRARHAARTMAGR